MRLTATSERHEQNLVTDFSHLCNRSASLLTPFEQTNLGMINKPDMKTKVIRKRHELFIHGSQANYIVLTALAAAVILAMIVAIAFLFNGIIN